MRPTLSSNGMFIRNNHQYWSKENPLRVVETKNQIRFSFNCWCGIMNSKVLLVHMYEGNLNAEKYIQIPQKLKNEIKNIPGEER